MLFALNTSVERAEWAPIPRLGWITLQSMLVASFLASIHNINIIFIHLIGLLASILLLQRIGISLITESEPSELLYLLSRISDWINIAITGGISDDPLPLSLWIITVCWLISYTAAWSIIRHKNIWWGILPSTITLVTVLSYLPDNFSFYFFMYITFAILLVAWLHGLQSPAPLRTLSSSEILSVSSINFGHSIWVALLLVITANFLPVTTILIDPLRKGYDQVHQPIEAIQEQFNRLFAGTTGKKASSFPSFGKTLPFKGPLSFQGVIVFTATPSTPTYWGAQVYSEYTSSGWIASESTTIAVAPESPQPFTPYSTMRTQDHVLTLNFPTTTLFMPGIPANSDRATSLVIAENTVFKLNLTQISESSTSYPADIRLWKERISKLTSVPSYKNSQTHSISELFSQYFPANTQIQGATFASPSGASTLLIDQRENDVESSSQDKIKDIILSHMLLTPDTLLTLSLSRLPTSTPDIVSLRTTKRMSTGDQYFISSKTSTASAVALRTADQQQPPSVTDRYLQLPVSIPERIRLLAEGITANETNQYDKVVALQAFLRRYEYNLTRDKHPHQSDAVDHFLFESKVGYCDDFASSLAIMARTLGIPTRIMAGYGPGVGEEYDDYSIIRDEDSHIWPEVFFTEYGWIAFEPTPKYSLPSRSSTVSPSDTLEPEPDLTNDMTDISGDEELFDQEGMSLEGIFVGFSYENSLGLSFRAAALFSLLIVMIVFTMLYGTWRRMMKSLGNPARTYSLMCTLGRLAGVKLLPSMTPFEYANFLTRAIPSAARSIETVSNEYVLLAYAKPTQTLSNTSILDNALKQIQFATFAKLLKLGNRQTRRPQ